jgi:hypothetical protein
MGQEVVVVVVVVVVNVYLFGRMPRFTSELPVAFAFYDLSLLKKAGRERLSKFTLY